MQYIEEFIKDCCVIDDTQKELSSNLYKSYKNYVDKLLSKSDDNLKLKSDVLFMSNKSFTQWFKKNKPEFKIKNSTGGSCYFGICLTNNYIRTSLSTIKTPAHIKAKKCKSNHKYYMKNRKKILDIKNRERYKRKIKQDRDKELVLRLNINTKQFFYLRYHNLICYSWNPDETVNWEETLKLTRLSIKNFQDRQNGSIDNKKTSIENKKLEMENRRDYFRNNSTNQKNPDVRMYQSYIQDYDKKIKLIEKKENKLSKMIDDVLLSLTDLNITDLDNQNNLSKNAEGKTILKIKKCNNKPSPYNINNDNITVDNLIKLANNLLKIPIPSYDVFENSKSSYKKYEKLTNDLIDKIIMIIDDDRIPKDLRSILKIRVTAIEHERIKILEFIEINNDDYDSDYTDNEYDSQNSYSDDD